MRGLAFSNYCSLNNLNFYLSYEGFSVTVVQSGRQEHFDIELSFFLLLVTGEGKIVIEVHVIIEKACFSVESTRSFLH